jgi:hypothetical protein
MALEDKIDALIVAIKALDATLKAGGPPTAEGDAAPDAPTPARRGRPRVTAATEPETAKEPEPPKEPDVTDQEVLDAGLKAKEVLGVKTAKSLVALFGYEKLADLVNAGKQDQMRGFIAAATKALEEAGDEEV